MIHTTTMADEPVSSDDLYEDAREPPGRIIDPKHQMRIDELNAQIDKYVIENDRGYVQGTDEWKAVRGTTIGGSEQSTVEGSNKYSSILELIRRKLGLEIFVGDIRTRWGNLFEDVIAKYVEADWNTVIKGGEAFLKGRFPTQSYSPDGIAVVLLDIEYTVDPVTAQQVKRFAVIDDDAQTQASTNTSGAATPVIIPEPTIVLFEFKCPFSRPLTGVIPEYYKPQIFAGMDTVRLTELAIFTEAVFRRCSWKALADTTEYDKLVWPREASMKRPLAYGFVVLVFTSVGLNRAKSTSRKLIGELLKLISMYNDQMLHVVHLTPRAVTQTSSQAAPPLFTVSTQRDDIADLGACNRAVFEKIFEMISEKILAPIYSPLVYCEQKNKKHNTGTPDEMLDVILDECTDSGKYIFGYLPYKLFKVAYMYESKREGYLDKWRSKIDEVIGIVTRCRENPADANLIISNYMTTTKPPSGDTCMFDSDEIVAPAPPRSNADLLAKLMAMKNRK